MLPIAEVIHNYYDKKRRLNFIRVTRMLNKDNPNPTDEPMPNLESDSESSNQGEDDDNNSAQSFPELVLPASLINSLYLKGSAFTRPTRKRKGDTSASSSQFLGVLHEIFKDPLIDVSSFSMGLSQMVDLKHSVDAVEDASFSPSPGHPIVLRDSLMLRKKKAPSLLDMNQVRAARTKDEKVVGNLVEEGYHFVSRSKIELSAKTNFLKKKNVEKAQGAIIVRKALDRREAKSIKQRVSKDKKHQLNLEESINQLRKSYQNLNIHININFNDRKKEQNSVKKCLDKDLKEEPRKEYPKLNLFSLICKTKKPSLTEAITTTQDTKANPSEEKTFSSLEFVKVFKKKCSEPDISLKGVKQTFLKKNSKNVLSPENPRSAVTQNEGLNLQCKDSLFGNKKHSVSSSINSIQQAVLSLGRSKVNKFKSAERVDSGSKKPIDIFEKKRKVSLVSNHPSTKSRKDLRSSMKSQKIASHRNNHSTNKPEPKSSRQSKGMVTRSAKKGSRKLFMSQDFNQSPQLLGSNHFDGKGQGFTMPLPFKQSLKGNLLNQANLLTGSHNKNGPLFTHKFNSTKESSLDPFGNLTYRSKKSCTKFTGVHAGSDLDLVAKRRKNERANQMKISEINLNHQAEPAINMSKKKKALTRLESSIAE